MMRPQMIQVQQPVQGQQIQRPPVPTARVLETGIPEATGIHLCEYQLESNDVKRILKHSETLYNRCKGQYPLVYKRTP